MQGMTPFLELVCRKPPAGLMRKIMISTKVHRLRLGGAACMVMILSMLLGSAGSGWGSLRNRDPGGEAIMKRRGHGCKLRAKQRLGRRPPLCPERG